MEDWVKRAIARWPDVPALFGWLTTLYPIWARLTGAARVTVVSAPPGSGKTVLLRSWAAGPGQAARTAWVDRKSVV